MPEFNSSAKYPLGTDGKGRPLCRCCGKPVGNIDRYPIHTKCIPKHWGKHTYGVNASRCKEFAYKAKKTKRRR